MAISKITGSALGKDVIMKDVATADGSSPTLTLQTGDTNIEADDVLGSINFQAPDEGTGTDAILVAAGISAVSEGDFSSSNNATSLKFVTGNSAAAGSDGGSMILSSTGNLTLKDLRTADGSSPTITLQSGDTNMEADDVLGTINFQAPDEGTGTDAILVAAGISAVSEGDFSSSVNATSLVFKTGASEAAATKMTINSKGSVGFGVSDGDVTSDGTAARTYVSIIGTGNRGRLNLGSTAVNGADAGTLAFTNGANTLVSFSVDTTSGVQNTGTLNVIGTRSIKIQAAASDEVVFNESGLDVDFRVEGDADTHALFVEGETDRVSIGSDDPPMKLTVRNGSANSDIVKFTGDGTGAGLTISTASTTRNDDTVIFKASDAFGELSFLSDTTEVLRLDKDNNVKIGNTNGNPVGNHVSQTIINGTTGMGVHRDGGTPFKLGTDGNREIAIFHIQGADVGSIDVSGSNTSYNTSSDYRLKENVTDLTNGITRLKQLSPKRFNFIKHPDTTLDGFLAHEAQAVVPESATHEKDATRTVTKGVYNSDGIVIFEDIEESDWKTGKEGGQYPSDSTWSASKELPVYQGIDPSKLVALLTAALQEAIVKIETLETKVAALEG